MKTLSTIIIILLASMQLAFAEAGKDCQRGGKLLESLSLEENQMEAVQQIMKQQHDKRKALLEKNRASAKEMMTDLHDETREKLSPVLNTEQLAKFDVLHEERKQKREERREKRKESYKERINGSASGTSAAAG